jgi:tetratricopeptide (TPR) repeat protein
VRAERHRLAGEWLEEMGRSSDHADMLAHHYRRASEYARSAGRSSPELEQRTRRALEEAGDRALALGALPAAAGFYEAALEHCPPDAPERPGLLLLIGRSRPDDATLDDAMLEEASEGLLAQGDVEGAAEAQAMLGLNWWVRGSSERAHAHAERAERLLSGTAASPTRAQVLSMVARLATAAGDNARAVEVGTEALRLAEALGRVDLCARNVLTIGTARASDGDPEGLRDVERSIELATEANLTHLRWKGMVNLASLKAEYGDIRGAEAINRQSVRVAAESGNPADIEWDRAEGSVYAYHGGRWSEAEEGLQEFLGAAGSEGHYMETVAREIRSRIRRARGDIEGAVADSEWQLRRAREILDPQSLYPALAVHADHLAAAGRPAEALEAAEELLAHWETDRTLRGVAAPSDLAWALAALGRPADLLRMIEAKPGPSRWVHAAEAILHGDFVVAAGVFDEIGSLPDAALARLRAAEALLQAGREDEAGAQLGHALAFYRAVGAHGLLRECEALRPATAR